MRLLFLGAVRNVLHFDEMLLTIVSVFLLWSPVLLLLLLRLPPPMPVCLCCGVAESIGCLVFFLLLCFLTNFALSFRVVSMTRHGIATPESTRRQRDWSADISASLRHGQDQ